MMKKLLCGLLFAASLLLCACGGSNWVWRSKITMKFRSNIIIFPSIPIGCRSTSMRITSVHLLIGRS